MYVSQLPHSDLDNGFFFKEIKLLTGLEPSGPRNTAYYTFLFSVNSVEGRIVDLNCGNSSVADGFFFTRSAFLF